MHPTENMQKTWSAATPGMSRSITLLHILPVMQVQTDLHYHESKRQSLTDGRLAQSSLIEVDSHGIWPTEGSLLGTEGPYKHTIPLW